MATNSQEKRFLSLLEQSTVNLVPRPLTEKIEIFGGNYHRVMVKNELSETEYLMFWKYFVRCYIEDGSSMVFAVIQKIAEGEIPQTDSKIIANSLFSIKFLREESRTLVLDYRTNIEREVEPTNDRQVGTILNEFQALHNGEIGAILFPTREGVLGPVYEQGELGPFTTAEIKYSPTVWDIEQEVNLARAIFKAVLSTEEDFLTEFKQFQIAVEHSYTEYAHIFANYADLTFESVEIPYLNWSPKFSEVERAFFDDRPKERTVTVGIRSAEVEQIIAYPYPTDDGFLYIRLFKVYDKSRKTFEVIRVLQTKPGLDSIDGLRIDSNCTDGVHSLDCHCDCKEQLDTALSHGFVEGKNMMVVQMCDHEGKNTSIVAKGSLQHLPVRLHNEVLFSEEEEKMTHVDAADTYYTQMDVPPDNRQYGTAQLVLEFLRQENLERGILDEKLKVEALYMQNRDKIAAVDQVVDFKTLVKLGINTKKLSGEAKRTYKGKLGGRVKNGNGDTVSYGG